MSRVAESPALPGRERLPPAVEAQPVFRGLALFIYREVYVAKVAEGLYCIEDVDGIAPSAGNHLG
jgi:hypothetical protein